MPDKEQRSKEKHLKDCKKYVKCRRLLHNAKYFNDNMELLKTSAKPCIGVMRYINNVIVTTNYSMF